jgi:ribosomal protein S18 acetylase RimI-like enzyme
VILLRNHPVTFASDLPSGWTICEPEERDAGELNALVRRHEKWSRGWASASTDDVRVEISTRSASIRHNAVLCDSAGAARGWASAHDRAAGRMLLSMIVDPRLDDSLADRAAEVLFEWGDQAASTVGSGRELAIQQIDTGAFADDSRQLRWLAKAGFRLVRTWWQMNRPVRPEDGDAPEPRPGVRIRRVERAGSGMPDEDDLRVVHDILEDAFADHFNSHTETFDEFLVRLREDPGHRWDHWWLAELVTGAGPEPVGALVGTVSGGGDGDGEGYDTATPASSYVAYIGVLGSARGRGVAKSLLSTVIADAARRGRSGVGLEVDADSPTGADALYLSMGWETSYVTQSWHRDVPVPS